MSRVRASQRPARAGGDLAGRRGGRPPRGLHQSGGRLFFSLAVCSFVGIGIGGVMACRLPPGCVLYVPGCIHTHTYTRRPEELELGAWRYTE
jgi:hypothetical protein